MQLTIKNVSKTYSNNVEALKDVTLEVANGMFGLLGPNGAGKSTLMRTIAGLQELDSGSITVGDIDVSKHKHELRKVLGYLPQEFGLYPKVNALELFDHLMLLPILILVRSCFPLYICPCQTASPETFKKRSTANCY